MTCNLQFVTADLRLYPEEALFQDGLGTHSTRAMEYLLLVRASAQTLNILRFVQRYQLQRYEARSYIYES